MINYIKYLITIYKTKQTLKKINAENLRYLIFAAPVSSRDNLKISYLSYVEYKERQQFIVDAKKAKIKRDQEHRLYYKNKGLTLFEQNQIVKQQRNTK